MIDSMGRDLNPVDGIIAIPCTGLGIRNTPGMSTKTVLAKNLKALMTQRPSLDTLPKITKATNGRLSNGKLDRVRRAAVATDIDTVEQLAEVFGVSAWQLLQEDMEVAAGLSPEAMPNAGAIGDAMRLLAAAIIKVENDDERAAIARMFSLLMTQPAKAGTTAQSIALLLTGAAAGQVPPETPPSKAPILEADLDIGDEKHGAGNTAKERKRKVGRG
jgi:hypothetical protein